MKIFVLGASGRTGRHVIDEALRRGHRVTGLVRPNTHLLHQTGLEVAYGDPRDRTRLSSLLADHDAVISCLGQRTAADATLLRDSATALIDAMNEGGPRRLVVISQGLLFPTSSVLVGFLRFLLSRHVADSSAMEALVRSSGLDWTVVRPPRLTDGKNLRGYRLADGAMPAGRSAMSRADLAVSLVDEIDTSPHVNAIVGVTSPKRR